MPWRYWLVSLLVAALAVPSGLRAQTGPETIRGRVTSDSGLPIRDATVSATMAPDRTSQQTRTDSAGRFALHFAAGTGDYLIHASAVGYKAVRRRLTRAPSDTALRLDLALVPEVTQLAAVRVQGRRERPRREDREAQQTGAADQELEGVFAALVPGSEGSLAAIANAIPGASSRPDGLSVLGLGGDQSNTTLNGMAFGGPGLPRNANARVRVGTSTYDPARGGFSGGQTSVELSPGGRFYSRRAHLTLDAPALQSRSPVADQLGRRYSSVNASIGGSGELVEEAWYYNNSLQISRRTSNAASLLSTGPDALRAAGVAPDSAARLAQLLASAQVPLTGGSVPGSAVSQVLTFASRLDHKPYRTGTYEPSTRTWNLTFYGNYADDQAQAFSPLSAPSRGGRRTALHASTQAVYSQYLGEVLNETRSALSIARERGTPYLGLPGGTVLVSSALADGDGALTGLAFGGNVGLDYSRRSWTWETINETHWIPGGGPHRLKLTLNSRLDRYARSAPDDLLGSFTYPSLAALEAGRPSAFSRALFAPAREGGAWSGFVSLGDYWRPTRSLALVYGARIEGNRFLTSLADNEAVTSAFGVSTAHAPRSVHVSPRLGFTYYFGRARSGGFSVNSFASLAMPPTMMLRGGIGEFRGLFRPELLAEASVANGIPGGLSRLTCIGAATPVPRWTEYLDDPGAIPQSCADGAPSSFTDASPAIRLFDPAYDAARSWRANLAWARTAGPFGLSVEGVYSLNLNQPGVTDLNFAGTPRFTLADEDERPVFVSPASIDAGTGTASPVESRAQPGFGRVLSSRSDLRSTSRQLTATLTPRHLRRVFYSLAYTLGDMRADARGFDEAAFGAPTLRERTAGQFDVRHQIQASLGTRLPGNVAVSLFTRIASGLPYTPRVSGDVNGDGIANDRAFVFDPASVADRELASGMRTLLDDAPAEARRCLLAQLGRPAARNGCRGPWTTHMNARVILYNRFGFTRRQFTVTLNASNPLGGLDQLLHGSGALRGWGSAAVPDPTLLAVRGFDPVDRRFRYEVNPRFGSARSGRQLAQAPFALSVDLTFDLGVPMVKQQAVKLLQPGRRGHRGARLSADSMMKPLARQVPDIYQRILHESDSLLISREQMDSLRAAQLSFKTRMDSLWMATTTRLAAMGDDYDADAAMHMIDDATENAWILNRDQLPTLARILSPLQMRMAPMVPMLQSTVGRKKVGTRMFFF